MKTLKIKIKTFEVFADPTDHESITDAIMLHLEELSEEKYFTATVVEDEEDESYEDDEELV